MVQTVAGAMDWPTSRSWAGDRRRKIAMNVSTLVGLLCIGVSLVLSFVIEDSHVSSYINHSAAVLVFGGTIGAAGAGTPMSELKRIPGAMIQAFLSTPMMIPSEAFAHILELSRLARREGIAGERTTGCPRRNRGTERHLRLPHH